MFQGSGTNLKAWNEYTKSKFLDRLKELGSVYTSVIFNDNFIEEYNCEFMIYIMNR